MHSKAVAITDRIAIRESRRHARVTSPSTGDVSIRESRRPSAGHVAIRGSRRHPRVPSPSAAPVAIRGSRRHPRLAISGWRMPAYGGSSCACARMMLIGTHAQTRKKPASRIA
jgi:hypothetical protein